MISLSGVSKCFEKREILKSVTLRLAAAQTHVFLGASGCGKTTLLRIIAGTTAPDSGEVFVGNDRVVVADPCPLADKLGYMTQEGGLFPHLRAEDNVTLVARIRGMDKTTQAARVRELSTLVGIDPPLLRRYPMELSGGQRQRVALMRALFLHPAYLLLDEPMAALDPLIRHELQETLRHVFSTLKTTVLMVTHDVAEAAYFGNTITLLLEGRVLQHGSFRDLVQKPADPYVTAFLRAQRPIPLVEEIPR